MNGLEQVQRILAQYSKKGGRQPRISKCAKCGIWLQESVTGSRDTSNGPMCSDCYFEEWGAIVERYPISTPRRR
jgi:hypothetical protein